MTNKRCLVYETLGKVSDLKVMEAKGDGLMRLEGVFGVCGVKNQNNRVYDKENYRQMVESLQQVIKESGCPGELEHPNSMNITLENVSHKIESIQMNEDGTITGTIALLNTPKGQIAQAIVEGGLPLFISSRGAGTITNEGRVTLSTIKTYDLVGTPGFSQAKLTLKENQTLECLNESVDEGNVMYAIVEGDDLLGDDDDKKDDKKEDDKADDKDEKKDEPKDDKKDSDKEDNKNTDNENIDMKDLKEAIDKLTDKVTSLEAELHVAKESLENVNPVNYDAIQKWVVEEFGTEFKTQLLESFSNGDNAENMESIQEMFEDKINEAIEMIATGVQNWVCEEFAPEVQNWICEEYSGELQNWICEEFGGTLEGWITEEFAPEHKSEIVDEVNENVNEFFESQKDDKLNAIDKLLESIDSTDDTHVVEALNTQQNNKFAGVYVVENMPNEYRPTWQMLDESRQNEIIRSSRMYDFTKPGVLESFWATNMKSEKFENGTANATPLNESSSYADIIASRMRALRLQ